MLTLYKDTEQVTIKKNIKQFLEAMLERENACVWIVLESSRDNTIKFFLEEYEEQSHYLFRDDDEQLQEAGAVALCLNDVPKALEWIATHWGKNWFSFFVTNHDAQQVISHLSSLCYLSNKEKIHLFRYYDPVTFACWIGGLKEQKRIDEALGIFSEVYAETPLPDSLMQYVFDDNTLISKEIDLQKDLKDFSFLSLSSVEEKPYSSLDGSWLLEQKEYDYLASVSFNTFKIKLCKTLIQDHKLLENLSLMEVYNIINREVARATRHGITQKHLLAHFVNIYFEHEDFWKKNQPFIQETLEQRELGEADKIEVLLEAMSDEKGKQ